MGIQTYRGVEPDASSSRDSTMTWVLILVVWTGSTSAPAIARVEFGGRAECFQALDASRKLISTVGSGSNAICTPTGFSTSDSKGEGK